MRERQGVEGFVLAGGKATRFGANKALAEWRGRSLLDYSLRALLDLGLTPRLVCPDPEPYRDLDHPLVLGERPDRGPTEALRVTLAACSAPRALIVTADMPLVTAALLRHLLAPPSSEETVVFETPERIHPFPGLYPSRVEEVFRSEGPPRSMYALLEQVPVRRIGASDLPRDIDLVEALWNVNRPEDLAARP